MVLNAGFVLVEAGFGFAADSLALLADAAHNLTDVGGHLIAWEAVQRIGEPSPVTASTVLWVAAIGIAVNAGTAMLFLKSRHCDLNVRGAFLHMATDAAASAGVVGSALVILATGWLIVDPVAALAVSLLVGWAAFDLLRSSLHLSLDGVPQDVDTAAVERWLRSLPGVSDVHDLHVWSLSTTSVALTAHLVMPEGLIESGTDPACRLAPGEVP